MKPSAWGRESSPRKKIHFLFDTGKSGAALRETTARRALKFMPGDPEIEELLGEILGQPA